MNSGDPPVRIAHAFGNHRDTLRQALATDVDMIEVDVWFRAGRIEVRHERRLGRVPLLLDRRRRGVPTGAWSLPLPRRGYVRLDLNPFRLAELLEETTGQKRLLVDVKSTDPTTATAFAAELVREFQNAEAEEWVAVCGQYWPVLDRLREAGRSIEVRYSMQADEQWQRYVEMARQDDGARRVCIWHRMLNEERAAFLRENEVDAYCWTVDDRREAQRLVELGVDGVISNDLGLLRELRQG